MSFEGHIGACVMNVIVVNSGRGTYGGSKGGPKSNLHLIEIPLYKGFSSDKREMLLILSIVALNFSIVPLISTKGLLILCPMASKYFANCLELNEKSHIFANRNKDMGI